MKLGSAIAACVLACGAVCSAAPANVPSLEKADLVKVSMVEKIASFIEWPKRPETRFVLCVSGEHPQLPVLRAYYENAVIAERPVAIQVVKRPEPGCHALFLAPRDLPDLARHRAAADREHILLIAESSVAARDGVHVAFYSDMGRLRLEVNRKALEASGLKASFRLLEVAKIVD